MKPDRDEYSGRYTREYEASEFIAALEELSAVSTAEVADVVGCSRDLAYRRLTELADKGRVEGESIGRTYRWGLTRENHS